MIRCGIIKNFHYSKAGFMVTTDVYKGKIYIPKKIYDMSYCNYIVAIDTSNNCVIKCWTSKKEVIY